MYIQTEMLPTHDQAPARAREWKLWCLQSNKSWGSEFLNGPNGSGRNKTKWSLFYRKGTKWQARNQTNFLPLVSIRFNPLFHIHILNLNTCNKRYLNHNKDENSMISFVSVWQNFQCEVVSVSKASASPEASRKWKVDRRHNVSSCVACKWSQTERTWSLLLLDVFRRVLGADQLLSLAVERVLPLSVSLAPSSSLLTLNKRHTLATSSSHCSRSEMQQFSADDDFLSLSVSLLRARSDLI